MKNMKASDASLRGADPPDEVVSELVKLSDVVYARIVSAVAAGDYSVGSKLPTENRLAQLLGVSRPVVREALARLRDNGIVVSRRGSGTYVRRGPQATDRSIASFSSIADMRRFLEFRISLEAEIAYHAALHAEPEGLHQLRAAEERLGAGLTNELNVDDDFAFHRAIAATTGNRFFIEALESLRATITAGMAITRNFAFASANERQNNLHDEHRAIVDAIQSRRPDEARDAMRRHLESTLRRAFEGVL